jgi:RNA polymerase sigma-70 factor (ECF subfamily)
LEKFRSGDESSFEELFTRHYDMVYGVLFRLMGSRAEAEDLSQEVFLKLVDRPLRNRENVAGWLYRVAANAGYNALRSRQRREQREERAVREAQLTGTTSGPEEQTTRRETQREVRAALAEINPRSAKLLILREMGFSYKELAEVAEVAPGSVGTLLARAQQEFEAAYHAVIRTSADARGEG